MFSKKLISFATLLCTVVGSANALPTTITNQFIACFDAYAPNQTVFFNVSEASTINIRVSGASYIVFFINEEGKSFDYLTTFPTYAAALAFVETIAAIVFP